MSSGNSEQESASFTDNINAFDGFMGVMSNVISKTKNIGYVANKNLTTIAGVVNCETLGVLGKPVALKEEIPDISGKSDVGHSHDIDDVVMTYEEEEEIVNEEEETVLATVTKTKPLSELLDGKAGLADDNTFTGSNTFNKAIVLNVPKIEKPINILTTSDLTANQSIKCSIGDSIAQTVVGYCKTGGNVPYAYLKLLGKSASISVFESAISMDTNLTINSNDITGLKILRSGNNTIALSVGNSLANNKSAVIRFNPSKNNMELGFWGNAEVMTINTNKSITMNGPLRINDTANNNTLVVTNNTFTTNLALMKLHQTKLASGNFTCYDLGTDKTNTYVRHKYYYHTTAANRYYGIIMDGTEVVKVFSQRVDLTQPLSVTGTITATGNVSAPNITTITNTLAGKADATHNHDEDYAAISHTHSISDVSNLQTSLDGKSNTGHVHEISDVDGLQTSLTGIYNEIAGKSAIGHGHMMADVDGLQTYVDSFDSYLRNHRHGISDIEDLGSSLTAINTAIDGKSDVGHTHDSDYAAISHTHSISDVSNLQTSLDGKASTSHNHDSDYAAINHDHDSDYAAINHSHEISDIEDLDIVLGAIHSDVIMHNHDTTYAAISHTHSISDVTNLQTALDGKASTSHNHDSDYAAINHDHDGVYAGIRHTHAISDITNLQTALDGKASTSHNHDTAYAAINHDHDTDYAAISHTHSISDVTNLQTSLDGKAGLSANNTFTGTNTFASIGASFIATTNDVDVGGGLSVDDDLNIGGTTTAHGIECSSVNIFNEDDNGLLFQVLCDELSNGENVSAELGDIAKCAEFVVSKANNEYALSIGLNNETPKLEIGETQTTITGALTTSGDITANGVNINTTLAGKANSSHTHAISDVTNLQTSLDGKANASHTHTTNDITNLKTVIRDFIYPVGSYFITEKQGFDPNTHFGGTWVRVNERFLWCSSNDTGAGGLGAEAGTATHTHTTDASTSGGTSITTGQMPKFGFHVNDAFFGGNADVSTWGCSYTNTGIGWNWSANNSAGGRFMSYDMNFGNNEAHNHSIPQLSMNSVTVYPPHRRVAAWHRTA